MPIASRITYATLAAARTISTGSIKVAAIVLTNTTGGALSYTITDAASSPATLMVISVPTVNTVVISGAEPFLFDKGMIVNIESASSHVTVFHSQDGT